MNSRAYQGGILAACGLFKLSEWNWELTGKHVKKDDICGDNGRRDFGTNFTEPGRPSREVSRAFDDLSSTKPSDLLNDANQALVGVTGGY